jgi:DNA polymerase-3 subunit delta'
VAVRLQGVIGQKQATARLEAELAAGRLAHAYLFVGPIGCGRATTARALFQAANCHHPEGEAPCGHCPSCRKLARGVHEDLIELAPPREAPSAQIRVEEVREMIRTLSFPPHAGGWRMVIIHQAEHLNPTSANALLKTLEEPPPRNILVLTVQDPGEILPTLVSRCRRVNFLPLPPKLITQELVARGQDPHTARLKAALAAGSLGRALELDHQALLEERRRLLEHLHGPRDPLADTTFAEEMVERFRQGGRIDRQALAQALEVLCIHFHDQAVAAAGRTQDMLLPPTDDPPLTLKAACQTFSLVRQAQNQILMNASPTLVLSVLLQHLRRIGGGSPLI